MRKIIFGVALLFSVDAYSLQSFLGKVIILEPTNMPNGIAFHMDTGNATCPAGAQLKWNKSDPENHKVIYSTLLAAYMSGKKVLFHMNDNDTACMGTHLHLRESN